MQCAHGGHQTNLLTFGPRCVECGLKLFCVLKTFIVVLKYYYGQSEPLSLEVQNNTFIVK